MDCCINCYNAFNIPRQYPINAIDVCPDILSILEEWIEHEVCETDHICKECFNFLTTEMNNRSEGNIGLRQFGHQSVRVGCALSISRQTGRLSRPLRHGSPEFNYIANIANLGQGKSTVLFSFLDKTDNPRETLVLEYSFGRKSNPKQSLEKIVCHVWEYGGKLDMLKAVLPSIPIRGKFYYSVMIDLSKIKSIWNTLEICIEAMKHTYYEDDKDKPDLIILCGKYDIFKNYDSDIKKFICTTLRSVALLHNAHLIFYSSKEQQLVRRAKELFFGIGFGNGIPFKERHSNFTKPMLIPKETDSWEHIGIAKCSLEQVKSSHISRISSALEFAPETLTITPQKSYPEPMLDSLIVLKYEELRNMELSDISVNEYLMDTLVI